MIELLAQVQLHDRSGSAGDTCVANNGFCPGWISDNFDRYVDPLVHHAFLTVVSVAIGFAISFALALLAHRRRWLVGPITQITGILYTLPSIAVFFLLLPITGRGDTTAIVALVAYSLLIIFRNIITGLDNVPDESKDAGRGMGLTDRQLLWQVELPLALPEIMAGLRIASTTTVGLATLAFFAGAGGLGEQIFADINFKSNVVVAGGLALLLAAVLDASILLVQRAVTPWTRGARHMSTTLAFAGEFGDAISYIFNGTTSQEGTHVGGSQFLDLLWETVKLAAVAMAFACAISIPIGLWLGHIRKGSFLAISLSNVGRAVPSLALIAFFVAYLGVGFANVTLALVLLAIPPILTNTYVAVTQVERETVDAARGMGMTEPEIVRRVELPLSLPLIFGGVRTSAVNVIATATIAPLAGVTTLGDPIINVSTYGDTGRLAAAIVVAALAVAAEVTLGAMQRAVTPRGISIQRQEGNSMKRQRRLGGATAALLLAGVLALSACGSDDDNDKSDSKTSAESAAAIQSNPDNKSVKLTIGSKNFTEQKVLGEIYAQGLAAAGYSIKTELNLGDEQTALKALESDQISAYPEYTGTALGSFFKVPSKDIPKDPAAAYALAKKDFAAKQLTALPPTPFTSSNEVGLTQETANELGGITKISDLDGKAEKLTLYGSPECRQRDDCLKGLQEVYGLKFKKFVPVAIDLRHQVLEKGQADLSIVFTTDPQNSRDKLVLLKDDKGMFPPYNSSLIVRDNVVKEAGPDLEATAVKVQKGLTGPVMAELNARVDLDKKTPAQVATEYLKESGLVE